MRMTVFMRGAKSGDSSIGKLAGAPERRDGLAKGELTEEKKEATGTERNQ